eukprot:SAG11_NODE_992_length_6262_cov_2.097193_5_plen_124_part_00
MPASQSAYVVQPTLSGFSKQRTSVHSARPSAQARAGLSTGAGASAEVEFVKKQHREESPLLFALSAPPPMLSVRRRCHVKPLHASPPAAQVSWHAAIACAVLQLEEGTRQPPNTAPGPKTSGG